MTISLMFFFLSVLFCLMCLWLVQKNTVYAHSICVNAMRTSHLNHSGTEDSKVSKKDGHEGSDQLKSEEVMINGQLFYRFELLWRSSFCLILNAYEIAPESFFNYLPKLIIVRAQAVNVSQADYARLSRLF